jgi:hypothetical protein
LHSKIYAAVRKPDALTGYSYEAPQRYFLPTERSLNKTVRLNPTHVTHAFRSGIYTRRHFERRAAALELFSVIVIGVSWDATIAGQKMHGQTFFDVSILKLERML